MYNPSEDDQMSWRGDVDARIRWWVRRGLTYYRRQTSMYQQAQASHMQAELTNGNVTRTEDRYGRGGLLVIGKEWFVSERWSLGLGAQFDLASIPTDVDSTCVDNCEENVTSMSGGLGFGHAELARTPNRRRGCAIMHARVYRHLS